MGDIGQNDKAVDLCLTFVAFRLDLLLKGRQLEVLSAGKETTAHLTQKVHQARTQEKGSLPRRPACGEAAVLLDFVAQEFVLQAHHKGGLEELKRLAHAEGTAGRSLLVTQVLQAPSSRSFPARAQRGWRSEGFAAGAHESQKLLAQGIES